MTHRYPEYTVATIEDFRNSGWREAIPASEDSCLGMHSPLSAAARKAIEEGRTAQGKVLWLLADACSMMLSPSSSQAPFRAVFEGPEGRRSALPEDFSPADIELLSLIAEEVDDDRIKARLADISWLRHTPRFTKYALMAIDAYSKHPLDQDSWFGGGKECWQRAIVLTRMLRDGAGDRRVMIESSLDAAFDAAKAEDGFMALSISRILREYGLSRNRAQVIAGSLHALGMSAEGAGDFHRAREHFSGAADWYGLAGAKSDSLAMKVLVAEGWAKEAAARTSGPSGGNAVAAGFYENAIQAYRAVPRASREAYGVEARLAELYRLLAAAGEKSLEEMGQISTPPMDVSDLVKAATDSVSGKRTPEAFAAFAALYNGPRVGKLRARALESMRAHPLSALFASTHVSKDGRTVAKTPGTNWGGEATEDGKGAVWAQMIRQYITEVNLVMQAQILPAHQVLAVEHRLLEADLLEMVRQSPIVPRGRERLVAKGLFFGYDQDFATAIHLLVPQVENIVRFHLKAAGVKTTNIDKEGIENENGMSTLADLPETATIFGEDLAFELKALFCDALGPNMRNEIAHGLLDDDECQSVQAAYTWYMVFRVVFSTFWNSLRGQGSDEAPETPAAPDGSEAAE